MKEKLLMNRYDEWLNVSRGEKRTYKRCGSRCRRRAQVRRLTKLASRLILSVGVGVSQSLGCEQHKQGRQGKR